MAFPEIPLAFTNLLKLSYEHLIPLSFLRNQYAAFTLVPGRESRAVISSTWASSSDALFFLRFLPFPSYIFLIVCLSLPKVRASSLKFGTMSIVLNIVKAPIRLSSIIAP